MKPEAVFLVLEFLLWLIHRDVVCNTHFPPLFFIVNATDGLMRAQSRVELVCGSGMHVVHLDEMRLFTKPSEPLLIYEYGDLRLNKTHPLVGAVSDYFYLNPKFGQSTYPKMKVVLEIPDISAMTCGTNNLRPIAEWTWNLTCHVKALTLPDAQDSHVYKVYEETFVASEVYKAEVADSLYSVHVGAYLRANGYATLIVLPTAGDNDSYLGSIIFEDVGLVNTQQFEIQELTSDMELRTANELILDRGTCLWQVTRACVTQVECQDVKFKKQHGRGFNLTPTYFRFAFDSLTKDRVYSVTPVLAIPRRGRNVFRASKRDVNGVEEIDVSCANTLPGNWTRYFYFSNYKFALYHYSTSNGTTHRLVYDNPAIQVINFQSNRATMTFTLRSAHFYCYMTSHAHFTLSLQCLVTEGFIPPNAIPTGSIRPPTDLNQVAIRLGKPRLLLDGRPLANITEIETDKRFTHTFSCSVLCPSKDVHMQFAIEQKLNIHEHNIFIEPRPLISDGKYLSKVLNHPDCPTYPPPRPFYNLTQNIYVAGRTLAGEVFGKCIAYCNGIQLEDAVLDIKVNLRSCDKVGGDGACNEGQCVNLGDTYYCLCPDGSAGERCTKYIACGTFPCKNNGTCYEVGEEKDPETTVFIQTQLGNASCGCSFPYFGLACHLEIDRETIYKCVDDPSCWSYVVIVRKIVIGIVIYLAVWLAFGISVRLYTDNMYPKAGAGHCEHCQKKKAAVRDRIAHGVLDNRAPSANLRVIFT